MFPRQDGQTESQRGRDWARSTETRRLWQRQRRVPRQRPTSAAGRGVRIFGGLLAAIVLALVFLALIGERYGTHAPTPGHHGKTIRCEPRQVFCF
jgi:hypothetical protein